jgi:hypothetical protein
VIAETIIEPVEEPLETKLKKLKKSSK